MNTSLIIVGIAIAVAVIWRCSRVDVVVGIVVIVGAVKILYLGLLPPLVLLLLKSPEIEVNLVH